MTRFTFYDVFVSFLSTATYVTDVGTDIWLIVYFFLHGHSVWGALTLGFVAMAAVTMQVFSFHWHVTDRSLTWKTLVVHMFFLAPLHRYARVLKLGFKSRSTGCSDDLDAAYREVNDVCILRLFETFLESAPQLVLQLFIIFSDLNNFGPVIGVSTVFSLLSVAWAVTAYSDALHLAYKKLYKRSAVSMVTHTIWQTGMITSRVFAIVLFATAFHSFVVIPLALHWFIMIIWITFLKPEFGSSPCERRLFVFVSALIHTFCFLNLKDGPSRWRLLFYYSLTLLENVVFVTMWYVFGPDTGPSWFQAMAFSVVFGGFAVGTACLLLYYGCCHPSGPVPLSIQKPELHKVPAASKDQDLKPAKLPIFDVTSTSARINLWLSASLDLSKEGLVEDPAHLHTPCNHGDTVHDNRSYGNCASLQTPVDVHVSPLGSTGSPNATKPLLATAMHTSYLDNTYASGRSRSNMYAADDRLDYSRNSRVKYEQKQDHSIPDYNLVEMFARCKLDPSFVSTASFNESDLHQSYQSNIAEKELSLRALNHSSLGNQLYGQNDSNLSKQSVHSSCQKGRQSMEFRPVNISPLDPNKLWEDSRLTFEPSLRSSYLYQSESALNMSPGEGTATITAIPDSSRGITHMSLSYSALDKEDIYNSPRNNSGLSERAPVFFFKQGAHFSRDSVNTNATSEGISFSNLSLQLPDSSADSKNLTQNPPDIVQCSSHDQSGGQDGNHSYSSNKGKRYMSSKRSPHDPDTKNRSVDSFYSRECSPSDRRSSFLSDRGLSSSDRGLSSSNSTNERSHRSPVISSGFQSEESNISATSPMYANSYHINNQYSQYQSTPIVENEISSIYELPSSIRSKRESLDKDVYSTSPCQGETLTTPVSQRNSVPSASIKSVPVSSLFFYTEASENRHSPVLPPLSIPSRSSSAGSGSSGSGRFFADPTLPDNDSQTDIRSEGESSRYQQSMNSSRPVNASVITEQSSLSAFLSDLSSSRCGRGQSSNETLSLDSDPGLHKKSYPERFENRIEKATSLPYMAEIDSHKIASRDRTGSDAPLYENIDQYSLNNSSKSNISGSSLLSRQPLSDSAFKQDYRGSDATEQTKLMELFSEMSEAGSVRYTTSQPGTSNLSNTNVNAGANVQNLTPQEVQEIKDSPCRLGRSVDVFDRDRWRTSLDKEMRDRLVQDMERLAPKKLYQLRSKNGTPPKKMPPMNISDYTESPYKFRRSMDRSSDYENLKNISPVSLDNDYENIHSLTHAIYTDYENVFDVGDEKTGNCPIASLESLSDIVFLDTNSEDQVAHDSGVDKSNSELRSDVRGELPRDSLSYSVNSISSDLTRTKSPINTSGINSAFKPVKAKKSLENRTPKHKRTSNTTFTVFDESLNKNHDSLSKTHDKSSSSSDRSSRSWHQKSRRQSNMSQESFGIEDTCNSTFQWSRASGTDSTAGTLDMSEQAPRNYLELAGKGPLSFSVSSFSRDDTSSQGSQMSYTDSIPYSQSYQHSYTDSIPWENIENKSSSFQNTADQNNSKYLMRQPLKALENTPVFSPIYGLDRRLSVELSTRKRFMSTPKLSTGSEMSMSRTPTDSASLCEMKTPHRRRSSGVRNETYSDNTSTWSTQSEYKADLTSSLHDNSSLSKTTYI